MHQFSPLLRLILLLFLLCPHFVFAESVTRGPYLQMASDNAVSVRWRTDTATDSMVRFGASPTQLNQSINIPGHRTEHVVRVTGLSSDTQYYYSVGTSSQTLAGGDSSYRFSSAPITGTSVPARIWIIGDSGTANSSADAVYNAYLNYSGSNNTDLWIMLGDNAYNDGTDNEYQDAVFDTYPELLRRSTLWATLGNHDGHTADSSTESGPYYDIFSLPRNAESGGLASGTEAYYSFDYGDIHFISLDSYETDRSINSAMMTWLADDLAANTQPWTIAFWHHPPYSKGSHNSDSESRLIDMRQNALPILESFGVDLVLGGHSHSYERSYLIDSHYGSSGSFNSSHQIDAGDGRTGGDGAYNKESGSANSGAVYTVAGSSGKISGGQLNHPAMFTALNQLGSVVLDVNGNQLDAMFLNSSGNVTDNYTVVKGSDTTAPELILASTLSASSVSVVFSETITQSSAQDIGNYIIDNGIAVNSAVLQADNKSVVLTTSVIQQGITYTLTVNNIEDKNNNVIATDSQINFDGNIVRTVSFQDGVNGYFGTQDSYIADGVANSNFGSATVILADGDDFSNGELVSLVKWDLSSIPSTAVVMDVQMVMNVFNSSSGNYGIWASSIGWNESSVTWNSVNPYSNRGGQLASFSPSTSGVKTVTLNSDGINTVQSWVDGSISNEGVFLMTSATVDGIDIRSSEYFSATSRPKLIITYMDTGASNQPPIAEFNNQVTALQVNFIDTSTDSDGSVNTWLWDFGDGTTSTEQNPSHTYASNNTYVVKLVVTDNDNATDIFSENITVTDGSTAVTVELQNGLNGYDGNEDTYVASGNTDSYWGDSPAILADGDDGADDDLVTLLQWDVSSILSGATVTGVTVTLQVFNPSSGGYNLWEMQSAWSQTNAVWSNTRPFAHLGVQVGSFTPTPTGSYRVTFDAAGIALVQGWIDDTITNNGICIVSAGTNNGIDMRASEYATSSQRPKMIIDYQY